MQPAWYIYLFTGLFGLAVGSFLNVLIYRLPRNKQLVFERSACPKCGAAIPLFLNIPVISYIMLLGKCRSCKGSISFRYPTVEILNAAFYLLFLYINGMTPAFAAHCYLASALITIFFIDLEFYIIPDLISIPSIFVGIVAAIFVNPPGIISSIVGAVVGGGILLGVAYLGEWIFKKEAMGGGDIKMAAMMGAFVGWQKILLVFMGGAFIGLIVSLIWMAFSSKIRRERMIPFGPFLATAAILTVIYGEKIINYYVHNFLNISAM